ncbi:MAG: prephenate dehydrogenase, partial [Clostridia bacterium]|nr:prephenate dehydrogenase [Clostridia bacterium]
MTIGIIGLGLIGGSMAKAIKFKTKNKVLGYDISISEIKKALLLDAIDEELTDEKISSCDIIILAVYPQATINYIKKHAAAFKKDVIVMDCCGVKRSVCDAIWPVAKEYGFTFIGGHPMAGIEYSGFNHAREDLFLNASMIFVPPADMRIQVMEILKNLCLDIGFGNIVITTAEKHDKIIACTSQLAHVVSSAYVKSPTAA